MAFTSVKHEYGGKGLVTETYTLNFAIGDVAGTVTNSNLSRVYGVNAGLLGTAALTHVTDTVQVVGAIDGTATGTSVGIAVSGGSITFGRVGTAKATYFVTVFGV